MPNEKTRRRFIQSTAAAGGIALAGCLDDDGEEPADDGMDDTDDEMDEETDDVEEEEEVEEAGYEIWALDQGRDNIHFYEPADDDEFDHVGELDLNELEGVPDEGVVPHMVDFSTGYEYAAVACTAGARTLIFDVETHELVADVDTGAASHFAGFSPDDEYIHVDAIGENAIVRVDVDLENEEFEVVDEIVIAEDDTATEAGIDEDSDPVCHQYDSQGRSIHTLGPSYHDGAVVVVDHDEFEIAEAWGHDDLPANCGTVPHPTEDKFYLTAGLPGEDGVGDYYVLDTEENELLVDGESTEGIDAHGFWFTPDGEELWVLNRQTNDGVVVDPETDEVVDEIDAFGPAQSDESDERDAPDIMWGSPDGEYMFVTLRGPSPLSGDPHAATGVTPGFAVLDVDNHEILDVVEPDPIEDYSEEDVEDEDVPIPDFHGIGVAVHDDYDTEIPTSPTY